MISEAIEECLSAIKKHGGVLEYRFHRKQQRKLSENKPPKVVDIPPVSIHTKSPEKIDSTASSPSSQADLFNESTKKKKPGGKRGHNIFGKISTLRMLQRVSRVLCN